MRRADGYYIVDLLPLFKSPDGLYYCYAVVKRPYMTPSQYNNVGNYLHTVEFRFVDNR